MLSSSDTRTTTDGTGCHHALPRESNRSQARRALLSSPPVVLIDYRYLEGRPDEAIHAVNHLADVFERLGGGAPRRGTVAYR